MTDDSIHIEFDATLDEFVDVNMRQVRRSGTWQRGRVRSMIVVGIVGSAFAVVVIDGLIGRPVGSDLAVAGVLGGFAGSLSGPLWERILARRMRAMLQEHYGASMPVRCEIELRPACLWCRQNGAEIELDWATAEGVEDTPGGVELWFAWGLVVARNRAFATPSDRERFLTRARALTAATPGQ